MAMMGSRYVVLQADTVGKLEEQVEQYLQAGYSVTGGIAVAVDSAYEEYFQAVVL